MLSLQRELVPADSVSCQRPPPILTTAGRGVVVAAGLLMACGGNPVDTRLPGPNDNCFGGFIGLVLSADTVAVGDSVHVVARPVPSFTSCFPGILFVATWEARPESAVSISSDSDTTTWVRGVRPAEVGLWARVRDAPQASGVRPLVVVP